MEQKPNPLDPLCDEIERALGARLYFAALAMTLALPAICVALESEDGRSPGHLYEEWCDRHLGAGFEFVTGKDIYSMRCGVLHEGRFGDLKHNVERVIFALPGNNRFVNCQFGDAYIYSVEDFCRNIIAAARKWFEEHEGEERIQERLPRMMQYRKDGISPYIIGEPVLG